MELHPLFRPKIAAVIHDMEGKGLRPRIQEAFRSPSDQLHAFNTGHSKLKFGYHNITKDGKPAALAVDMLDDDSPADEGTRYLLILASAAESHGLHTGIRWGVPDRLQLAIDKAIAQKDWNAKVKVGWDPTHTEPTTYASARAAQTAVTNGTFKA